jgi:hypothetical protein
MRIVKSLSGEELSCKTRFIRMLQKRGRSNPALSVFFNSTSVNSLKSGTCKSFSFLVSRFRLANCSQSESLVQQNAHQLYSGLWHALTTTLFPLQEVSHSRQIHATKCYWVGHDHNRGCVTSCKLVYLGSIASNIIQCHAFVLCHSQH